MTFIKTLPAAIRTLQHHDQPHQSESQADV